MIRKLYSVFTYYFVTLYVIGLGATVKVPIYYNHFVSKKQSMFHKKQERIVSQKTGQNVVDTGQNVVDTVQCHMVYYMLYWMIFKITVRGLDNKVL